MSVWPEVGELIRKYRIRSVINAPCGTGTTIEPSNHGPASFDRFARKYGVTRFLHVDIVPDHPGCVEADLCYWRPEPGWDAVYINCIFCSSNSSKTGNHRILAQNYATWPVRYIIVADTPLSKDISLDWHPSFLEAGWRCVQATYAADSPTSLVEIWEHAEK